MPALDGSALTGMFSSSYAIICDEKTTGTNAGGAASDTTHDRTLNTKVYDPDSIVTLHSSNQFRLGAGTYIIEWSAPAYDTNEHIATPDGMCQDVTNGSTISMGSSEYSGSASNVQSRSMGGEVTISTNTDYKIQHW